MLWAITKLKIIWVLSCYFLEIFSFTFRSLVHFGLIFAEGLRTIPRFLDIIFAYGCPNIMTNYWKTTFWLVNFLCFFVKYELTIHVWVYILILFCSLDLFVLSPVWHCSDYCSSVVRQNWVVPVFWFILL